MASVRKTVAANPSWRHLTEPQRALLERLTLSNRRDGKVIIDGLWGGTLTRAEHDTADGLLTLGLVEWRDLVLRATPLGLGIVVRESGLVGRKAVG